MGMAETIYNALDLFFGEGIAGRMSEWMTLLYSTILTYLEGNLMTTVMTVFSALACTMLTLFFFAEIVNQASRDMFSFEKLIVMFIKFLVGFVLLLTLQDLVVNLAKIGNYLYQTMEGGSIAAEITSGSSVGITFTFDGTSYDNLSEVDISVFQSEYTGLLKNIPAIPLYIWCLFLNILGMIGKFAGYFICTSNGLIIIVRAVFMPIAIVQCFEDGTKSAGIKYVKAFAAECITMAVIIIILYAANAVTSGLVANSFAESGLGNVITFDNIGNALAPTRAAYLLIPLFAAIGGMAGGSKIAHDVLGA